MCVGISLCVWDRLAQAHFLYHLAFSFPAFPARLCSLLPVTHKKDVASCVDCMNRPVLHPSLSSVQLFCCAFLLGAGCNSPPVGMAIQLTLTTYFSRCDTAEAQVSCAIELDFPVSLSSPWEEHVGLLVPGRGWETPPDKSSPDAPNPR